MKKLLPIAFSLLLCSGLFTACEKDYSNELNNLLDTTLVTGNLSAKINGNAWVANQFAYGTLANGTITITGKSSNGKRLDIVLRDTIPGTYALNMFSSHVGVYRDSVASSLPYTTFASADTAKAGGVVVISSIDKVNKKMYGSFRLKLHRLSDTSTVSLTEGSFAISYSPSFQNPTVPNQTDTVSFKLDGANWDGSITNVQVSAGKIIITNTTPGGGRAISMTVDQAIAAGSYSWDGVNVMGLLTLAGPPTMSYIANGGNLTVFSNDTGARRLRASFTFTGQDIVGTSPNRNITNGFISVRY